MRIPVTNHGDTMLHVGGKVIRPGETRHIDAALVPESLHPQTEQAQDDAPADPLLALLDGNAKEIAAALAGLSLDQLAELEAAEEAGKTRKGVMASIADERLRRADAAQG